MEPISIIQPSDLQIHDIAINISTGHMVRIASGYAIDNWEFKPVIITEDIMNRCPDFRRVGTMYYSVEISYFKTGFRNLTLSQDYLTIDEWDGEEELHKRDLVVLWNRDIMKEFYLHELQRIYKAITRKELKFNL